MQERTENPLGSQPIGKLMLKFSLPSIVAMLVGAVYNIVDQIFIGNTVGTLGNGATNIAFPFSMSCTAVALLFGIGGAARYNLSLGEKNFEKAPYYIGNCVVSLLFFGTLLALITQLFLDPLLLFFGSTEDILPYAHTYVRISAIGFPFLVLTVGGGHLIRADGSPVMTMIVSLSGALINVGLDALFMFGLHMGMFGAALATVIGQVFSALLVVFYLFRFKTSKLTKKHFKPNFRYIGSAASLGIASCVNQFAMMITQITLNNQLKYYGALSEYGSDVCIACAGIVMKVSQIFFSVVIGIAQGSQPIESYNYGAKNYARVKKTYLLALGATFACSLTAFTLFQVFPRQLLSVFGNGTEEYFRFGERFFRIFLFATWLNCIQPATSQFFASVGKPVKGMFVSLTRQILFLLPLMLLLPLAMGIDGILFSGPIADAVAAFLAMILAAHELRKMMKMQKESTPSVRT